VKQTRDEPAKATDIRVHSVRRSPTLRAVNAISCLNYLYVLDIVSSTVVRNSFSPN